MNNPSLLNGPPSRPHHRPRKSTARLLWVFFSLFVVYGTTFPFSFHHEGYTFADLLSRINWNPKSNIPDMVQNVLLFIPFGLLGYFSLIYKSSLMRKLAVVFMGSLLSFSVECLQIFSLARFPSFSDLIFNTMGAALGVVCGVLLKKSVLGFKSHPTSRRFLDAPSAFPALVFFILVVVGCWEPFNFSLDVGSIWSRVKPLIQNPIHFSLPDDDVFSCIQFLLASLFMCRVLQEGRWPRPALSGVLLMYVLGIGLECSQFIIQSRYPEVQDALVGMLGTTLGGIIFLFPGFREKPWIWSGASLLGIFFSAAVRGLNPFEFQLHALNFNWVPFLPQYQQTTTVALGEFMANAMVYFPLGFLLGYFFPKSKPAPYIALMLAGTVALVIEIIQGYVVSRYSDITSVIGAVLGSMIGSLVLTRGWSAFTIYMREEEDHQV